MFWLGKEMVTVLTVALGLALGLATSACSGSASCGCTETGTDAVQGNDTAVADPGTTDLFSNDTAPDAPPDATPDATPDAPPDANDDGGDNGPDRGPSADTEPDSTADADGQDVFTQPACPVVGDPRVTGMLSYDDLQEVSGLVASRTHDGVLWAHNDSGDTARFFAVDGSSGNTLAEFAMVGITAEDFEDIAIGPFAGVVGDALFLADTGDNGAAGGHGRESIVIHVVAEPSPAAAGPSGEVTVVASIPLTYPDGPVDCESFFVDPHTGDFYLVAKEVVDEAAARVFRKAAPHDPLSATTTLEEIARVPAPFATGADISADGGLIAIRTYFGGVLYLRGEGQSVAEALAGMSCELPSQSSTWNDAHAETQGESIALLPDGTGYVTVSEGKKDDPTSQELHFWSLTFED